MTKTKVRPKARRRILRLYALIRVALFRTTRRRAERSERVARQERTAASRVSRLAVSDE